MEGRLKIPRSTAASRRWCLALVASAGEVWCATYIGARDLDAQVRLLGIGRPSKRGCGSHTQDEKTRRFDGKGFFRKPKAGFRAWDRSRVDDTESSALFPPPFSPELG